MNTQDQLTNLLDTRLGVPAAKVEAELTFRELALDSLALMELTMVINKEFGIELDDWALTGDTTVQNTVELIESMGAQV